MVSTQIRDGELIEANRMQSLCRVKWLDTSNKSKKLFFTLLEAKQQRESINILITNTGTSITEEEAILMEVTRFYSAFFSQRGTVKQLRRPIQNY